MNFTQLKFSRFEKIGETSISFFCGERSSDGNCGEAIC